MPREPRIYTPEEAHHLVEKQQVYQRAYQARRRAAIRAALSSPSPVTPLGSTPEEPKSLLSASYLRRKADAP